MQAAGGSQKKWRAWARGLEGRVRLGTPCENQDDARRPYSLEARSIYDDASGQELVLRPALRLAVGILSEW